MTSAEEHRPRAGEHGSHAPRPLYAVVGATDLAVERAKEAVGDVRTLHERMETGATRIGEGIRRGTESIEGRRPGRPRRPERPRLDRAKLQERARRAGTRAVTATARAADRAGQEYERLADRGKDVVDRFLEQPSTQNVLAQGKDTWGRTRQTVESARRTVDEKAGEALATLAARRAAHRHGPVEPEDPDHAPAGTPPTAGSGQAPVPAGDAVTGGPPTGEPAAPREPDAPASPERQEPEPEDLPPGTGARGTAPGRGEPGGAAAPRTPADGKPSGSGRARPAAGPGGARPATGTRARKAPGQRAPRASTAGDGAPAAGEAPGGTRTPRARKRTAPPSGKGRSNRRPSAPREPGEEESGPRS